MRVLLIIPTVSYATAYPAYFSGGDFPVGFAYLASALRNAGHEVVGLNPNNDPGYGTAYEMLATRISRSLRESPPALIGIGGLCTDFLFLSDTVRILRELAPGVPIVCGGGIINNDAEFIFRTLRPDFCIIGEGEEILVRLADTLGRGGTDFERIPNLGYWAEGQPRFTRQDFTYGDLDGRAFPDYSPFGIDAMLDDFSFAARYLYRYTRPDPRPMTLVAARSCPFNCTFCVHQRGIKYRARSVANIIEEIRYLYERHAFNILIIVDELFAADKARLAEFCTSLCEAKARRGWDFDWLFQTHASAALDEAALAAAKDAGCYFFSYGLESASPKVLASMNKRITPAQISGAVRVAEKAGIGFGGNFIFGDVAETPETIVETVEFFSEHCRDAHIFFADVKPYPGSKLFDRCIEKGIIKDKLAYYQTIDNVLYNMTSMEDATWLAMLRQIYSLSSYGYVKAVEARELRRADPPPGRGARILGNRSLWDVRARCPHCAGDVRYREPVDEDMAGRTGFHMVTGCPSCHKRLRVTLRADAMRASTKAPGPPARTEPPPRGPSERRSPARPPSLLFLCLDYPAWHRARSWSYVVTLGFEEGFRAARVDHLTIPVMHGIPAVLPASLLSRIRDICAGRRFDQVWIELVHSPLDGELLEYLASLAPVRLGILGESLQYPPEAYSLNPHLRERHALVEGRMRYMTHVLAVDERDVAECRRNGTFKAMWWPSAVPERFICERPGAPPESPATFCGALYGVRSRWLEHPSLAGLLVQLSSPEDATPYPGMFDKLNRDLAGSLRGGLSVTGEILEAYLSPMRRIRQESFSLWLESLRSGCAVVNLPSFLQAYGSRVVEGMAAGRPVISWEIPDRPRNRALFEDGEEILLFPKDEPAALAEHIGRVRSDPDLALRISSNARRTVWRFHTMEKRVRQVLDWIETGQEPIYSDAPREDSLDRKIDLFHAALGGRGGRELSGEEENARHLKEALRIRHQDPVLWMEIARLAASKNDHRTVEAAVRKTLQLTPDAACLLPALEKISAAGSPETKRIMDRLLASIPHAGAVP